MGQFIITVFPNEVEHHLRRGRLTGESVMRHFLALTLTPVALASGMMTRASRGALVARTGVAHRRVPPDTGAVLRAVDVAVVAIAADPRLALAVLAVEQPVVVLAHRDPTRRGLDIRRASRHKGAAEPLTSSTATQKARGLATRSRAFAFLGVERSIADAAALCAGPHARHSADREHPLGPLPRAQTSTPVATRRVARTERSNQQACGLVDESCGAARALRAVWTAW
jgi:hypothetical protein